MPGVSRDERGRLLVRHLPVGPGDLELRRVPVPDQVDLERVDGEGVVDPDVVGPRGSAGRWRVGDVGIEVRRLAARLTRLDVARGELVERQRERREVRPGDEPPGVELIERRGGVGERLPLHQQLVGLVAEQPARRDREQHAEQRQVEQQVADLTQVALLRRHPVLAAAGVGPPQPEPLPAEQRGGAVDGRLGRQRGREGRRVRQPVQVARRARRRRARRADQPEGPRHHAPDKRREKQQVDRGEPGRGEHVEQPEAVQPGRDGRVRGVVLLRPRPGRVPCCGSTDPGIEPSASRNSRISAVRMEVSCRHPQRSQPAPAGDGPDPAPAPPSATSGWVPNERVASSCSVAGSGRTGGVHIGHWVTAALRRSVVSWP